MASRLAQPGFWIKTLLFLLAEGALIWTYIQKIERVSFICSHRSLYTPSFTAFCDQSLALHYLHFSLLSLALALFLLALYLLPLTWRNIWRSSLCFFVALYLLVSGYWVITSHIADVRTYSYELFITAFYTWMTLCLVLLLIAVLFPPIRRAAVIVALLFTAIATVLFTLEGRGSVEHITPLLGGLFADVSFYTIRLSALFSVWMMLTVGALAIALIWLASQWVRSGHVTVQPVLQTGKYVLIAIAISSLSLLSIPFGNRLNQSDVAHAKGFIETFVPKLEGYYSTYGQYPKNLDRFLESITSVPRLIDIFEYLAHEHEGSYYLSRPQKYCFVFLDPGRKFGYHAYTSDTKKWQYFSPLQSLENEYLNVCGDDGPTSHEAILADHLGLKGLHDPLGRLGAEVGMVTPPPGTRQSTQRLKNELQSLGRQEPSIYGTIPGNTQELRALLHQSQEKAAPVEE